MRVKKLRSLYCVLVVISGLIGLTTLSFAQDIKFELVPRPADEFGGGISNIIQDKQGFLWLAMQRAFFRYDGQHFTNFTHDPSNTNSPADFQIWHIFMDHDGIIWLSPGGFGLDRFDPATGIFTHYRHNEKDSTSVSNDEVTAIFEDRKGTLWIGTTSGLDKFDTDRKTFTHYKHDPKNPNSLSCNDVRVIYQDRQGVLWIGTGNPYVDPWAKNPKGGLNKFDPDTGIFTRFIHIDGDEKTLADNRVQVLYEDTRGVFWVGTALDGLHTFDRATGKFTRHSYDPAYPHKLSRPKVNNRVSYVPDYITFITEDAVGRIWIGAYEAAISVYDPKTQTCYFYDPSGNGKDNVNGNGYWDGFMSSDNTMWISSSAGTAALYKVKPEQPKIPHVTIHKQVVNINEDKQNNLWLGTASGLIKVPETGKMETFLFDKSTATTVPQFKPGNIVYDVLPDGNQLWTATYQGLHQIDLNSMEYQTFRPIQENTNSIASEEVNILRKARDNKMWVGTNTKGLDLFDPHTKKFKHFVNDPSDQTSLSNNRIISMTVDSSNILWVGSFLGLNRFDSVTKRFKRYLNDLAIISLYEDHSGQLWCGTDVGLFQYNKQKDRFQKFEDTSGLIRSSIVVGSVMEDRADNLWFFSPQMGMIRLNKDRTNSFALNEVHGVNRDILLSPGFLDRQGRILIGDSSGYLIINPDSLERNTSAPIISIDNFLINEVRVKPDSADIFNGPLNQSEQLNLRYDQNTFSFEFTDIDFISDAEHMRVLYQLENYDNGWRRDEDKRTAHYFNLAEGKYVFKVKAVNSDGVEAERKINIIIYPPWWKTIWAYVGFILVGCGIALALYQNRIRQLKAKQDEQLGFMVATQEGERKRISRDLHDEVGTKLSALKLMLSSLGEKANNTGNDEIKSLAGNSEQFITEVMQDVRQLLLNLSPILLEEFGYTTAVEALVGKLNETKKIQFNLVVFGWSTPIKKDYELALYRITQELINNVLRHSEAKNVSLQIGQRDEKIILMIEDDGKGFEVSAHQDGYGLRNLDARTKIMKGTLTIDSQPGKGTSVMIEIPYNFTQNV